MLFDSSGTTSPPKGVELTHHNSVAMCCQLLASPHSVRPLARTQAATLSSAHAILPCLRRHFAYFHSLAHNNPSHPSDSRLISSKTSIKLEDRNNKVSILLLRIWVVRTTLSPLIATIRCCLGGGSRSAGCCAIVLNKLLGFMLWSQE